MAFFPTHTRPVCAAVLLALFTSGCATTYVPVSWNFREQVRKLAQTDPTLEVLFGHCDPKLSTLRFNGESFSEVMMPSEVQHHLGAYRRDTGIIYRNLQYKPNEQELRDLLVHEVSHHCWYTALTENQRTAWLKHLEENPSPVQAMVRAVYSNPDDYDTEDFAFTLEYARPVDIEKLVALEAITPDEGQTLLKSLPKRPMPEWHVKKETTARAASKLKSEPSPDGEPDDL